MFYYIIAASANIFHTEIKPWELFSNMGENFTKQIDKLLFMFGDWQHLIFVYPSVSESTLI